ncbi:MAG: isoprenyl transferase [Cyclobacteriaceae bacterium]|nr:isoprenyl transferase [Cyclobacteriaceae bacterium]
MDKLKEHIKLDNIPEHVAVIMDGNGRWAKKKGAMRIFGHKNAIKAVREATEGCAELGVKYLTLYAFSTENWARPKAEVDGLMELLVNTIKREMPTLNKNNVQLNAIGKIDNLPSNCKVNLEEAIKETAKNTGLILTLALSYSGRQEIVEAAKKIAIDVKKGVVDINKVNEDIFSNYLDTDNMPDPELMIRTSGEMRISNFLLWQLAYSELYMTETLWPDFRKKHLYEAIISYQNRERRFGKVSEQVKA